MYSSLILAGLVAAVSALPNPNSSPPSSSCKTQSQNANFDDLTGIPATSLSPLPVPYKGLLFQGFDLDSAINAVPGVAPGVVPHSAPNYATSNAGSTTLAGTAEWTTNYQASTVKSFTPQSFYYGCVTQTETGVAALPAACNIAITGFRSGDVTSEAVQVASQEFSYNPTTTTGQQQMVQGVFSSAFANVQYVLIQYSTVGGQAALQVDLGLLIDDVQYTTCS